MRWLKIIKYQEFYDIPRYMLVSDEGSRYWLLDCGFDKELDEYPSEFLVFPVGTDLPLAQETFDLQAKNPAYCGDPVLILPIKNIEFDPTKRKECLIRTTEPAL